MKYCVAEHIFVVDAPQALMRKGYEPFLADDADPQKAIFSLKVTDSLDESTFELEVRQEDEGQTIEAGHIGSRPAFRFSFGGRHTGTMLCDANYRDATLSIMCEERSTLDNALMVLYALATADKGTLLMHASVTVNNDRGYLFIAPSGTGKSTHSRLWQQHILGSWLLNDDNPVVRIAEGKARVYGSPWSGKTPCYKNEQCPVGAVVRICQAPCNEIRPLKGIAAYAEIMAATSGKRWDRQLTDGLHQTLNQMAQSVPTYRLDCLPDAEAAHVCFNRVKENEA